VIFFFSTGKFHSSAQWAKSPKK